MCDKENAAKRGVITYRKTKEKFK